MSELVGLNAQEETNEALTSCTSCGCLACLLSSSPSFEIDPNPKAYTNIKEIQVPLIVWKQIVGGESEEYTRINREIVADEPFHASPRAKKERCIVFCNVLVNK